MNLNYIGLAAIVLLAVGFLASPVSADPQVIAGPCAHLPNTAPGYRDCYGVTNHCNSGSVQLGVGHSFDGPSDGGGWCWVSIDTDNDQVCENVNQQGNTCV